MVTESESRYPREGATHSDERKSIFYTVSKLRATEDRLTGLYNEFIAANDEAKAQRVKDALDSIGSVLRGFRLVHADVDVSLPEEEVSERHRMHANDETIVFSPEDSELLKNPEQLEARLELVVRKTTYLLEHLDDDGDSIIMDDTSQWTEADQHLLQEELLARDRLKAEAEVDDSAAEPAQEVSGGVIETTNRRRRGRVVRGMGRMMGKIFGRLQNTPEAAAETAQPEKTEASEALRRLQEQLKGLVRAYGEAAARGADVSELEYAIRLTRDAIESEKKGEKK